MGEYKKCDCCGQTIFTEDELIELENGEKICPACISRDCDFIHNILED
ncbi:unnamed protein product [marine sediment metagenome]|uniref:Uncharacterized protein n=1 Tax=marine sediment metagenome TaxID=412755 RepID=X1H2W9_9ZZZZ